MIRKFGPHEDPDLDSVWLWFEFQSSLISESRAGILHRLRSDSEALRNPIRQHETRFIGLTRREIEDFFDAQRGQLELLTMFELLATTEAILRIEFKARVAERKKDGLSRRFRKIDKATGRKTRLDEDILGAIKEEGVPANVVAAFRGALKLRHWLAHGRHWHPKLGRGYTPGDVFEISRALIDAIPPS